MEKRSFDDVYRDMFKPVYNYIYMQLLNKELAEDIVSDAFMKAYRAYDKYSPAVSSEKTWIFRIAKNLLIDHYRRTGTRKEYIPGDEVLEAVSYNDKELEAIENDTNRIVYQVLSFLREEEREIITMRYIREMSNPEIAQEMGTNAKAVSERIRRILNKCRRIMDENKI